VDTPLKIVGIKTGNVITDEGVGRPRISENVCANIELPTARNKIKSRDFNFIIAV
jgi:hypothetical protein